MRKIFRISRQSIELKNNKNHFKKSYIDNSLSIAFGLRIYTIPNFKNPNFIYLHHNTLYFT